MAQFAVYYEHEFGLRGETQRGLLFCPMKPDGRDPIFYAFMKDNIKTTRPCRFCGEETSLYSIGNVLSDEIPADKMMAAYGVATKAPIEVLLLLSNCTTCNSHADKRCRRRIYEHTLLLWTAQRVGTTAIWADQANQTIENREFKGHTALVGFKTVSNILVKDGDLYIYGADVQVENIRVEQGQSYWTRTNMSLYP